MNLVFETEFLIGVLLLSLRIGVVFLLTPLLSVGQVPARVRILLVLGISAMLLSALNMEEKRISQGFHELLQAAIFELVNGGLLAFGVFAAFAAFHFGGRLLDFQMGYSVANLIDPVTQAATPLIGTALQLMAVIAFYMIDGHHMIVRGLAFSLEQIPLGMHLAELPAGVVLAQFGVMFSYGLVVVAPAVLVLLLLDVAMALAARTMPQVNMFIVGMPLKIFVGLMVLAISIDYMSPLLERIYSSIFRYWDLVLD